MAVTTVSGLTCCKNLTTFLTNEPNLPQTFVQENGMVFALKSNNNVRGYETMLRDIEKSLSEKALPNTSFPKIQARYVKPKCTAGTTATDVCTAIADSATPFGYLDVTVDGEVWVKETFTRSEYDALCYSMAEDEMIKLERLFQAAMRAMDADLIDKAEALMGNYFGTTTSSLSAPRTLNLVDAKGAVNPMAMQVIRNQYTRMGASGWIGVGGVYMDTYKNALALSVPNNSTGLDATKLKDESIFFDSQLDGLTAAAGCGLLTWANGTLLLVEAYRYDGDRYLYTDYDIRETRTYKGIKFDFTMHFDACTDQYVFTVRKNYDLWYIPTAAYSCLGTGVNMKLQYVLGCGDMDCTQLNVC